MAQLFVAGETKKRPGVYYRYSDRGQNDTAASLDGVNAIVIAASWGPVGKVTSHASAQSVERTYGSGDGVEAAKMLFVGGAKMAHICRPEGSNGSKAKAAIGSNIEVTAKYPGTKPLSVKVQTKAGDETKKQFLVLGGTTLLETFEFATSDSDESVGMKEALAKSEYVDVTTATAGDVEIGTYTLEGGVNPVCTSEDYLDGFEALESYRYNVLTTDSVDAGIATMVKTYVKECEAVGKLIIGVIGVGSSTAFETKLASAKACDNKQIVYFGSGYVDASGNVIDGVKAINYVAGAISSTPSNKSIVHKVVTPAVDVTEKLTIAQYEEAIANGLLILSVGPDGQVWFDSGVNTLINLAENEDEGWKKIKRTRLRYELFDRIDRVVAPLVGNINCDADGTSAVIQAGMGVINSMIAEKKLMSGASMSLDPDYEAGGDSAWFVITADDIDALEKIYLHYQFRYNENV